jgi:hypothetical protein
MGTSPGPSCLIHPSFPRLGGTEAHAQAQETLILRDSAGQEARRACSEWMWLQKLKRRVEDILELMCSWAACAGKTSPVASSFSDRGILYVPRVSFFSRQNRGWNLVLAPTRGDAEGLGHKVALLEGELVEAHRARDVTGERDSLPLIELIGQGCVMANGLQDGAPRAVWEAFPSTILGR